MSQFNFNCSEYLVLRKSMNRNFRVKVGSKLVGFSGFVLAVGYERAKAILMKALRLIVSDVFRFKTRFGIVSFYVK